MKRALVVFYLFLLLVLLTWTDSELPPMLLRLVYLFLVVTPIVLVKASLFPMVLSTFVLISSNRYAPSYMPFLPQYLLVVSIIALVISGKIPKIKLTSPCLILILIVLHTSIVDLITSHQIPTLALSALVVLSFFFFIQEDTSQRSRELTLSFVIIAFILSLEMVIYGSRFTQSIMVGADEYDRIGWNDPNYFSALIGIGVFSALQLLFSKQQISRPLSIFLILTIGLALYVLLKVASRGALVALSVSVIVLVLFSKRKGAKYLTVLSITLLLVYLFGGFDFILARFENDGGEIGGRSIIWSEKLIAFIEKASFENWVVGFGKKEGYSLASIVGGKSLIGFHNDYLSFFICYGILGALYLLLLLLIPIFKYKNLVVTSGILYIIVICLSLEPMSGLLDFYYFYFYLIILGENEKQQVLI